MHTTSTWPDAPCSCRACATSGVTMTAAARVVAS
ncbi:Uncharacterised protein [Bordetella pertussis]|nr:Uncharacterised protein [Bordetella pertussis]